MAKVSSLMDSAAVRLAEVQAVGSEAVAAAEIDKPARKRAARKRRPN